MSPDRRRRFILGAGVALMLLALLAYMGTLDDSDPDADAVPRSEAPLDPGP